MLSLMKNGPSAEFAGRKDLASSVVQLSRWP
jgi:hypothetical protein